MHLIEKIYTLEKLSAEGTTVLLLLKGAKSPLYGTLHIERYNDGFVFRGFEGYRQRINPLYRGLSVKKQTNSDGGVMSQRVLIRY